jgi:rubrerythrin
VSEIVDLLREQMMLELSHVERIKPTMQAMPSRLASAVLESIIHDSYKHAALCGALVDVEAGSAPVRLEIDPATAMKMAQSIREHIRVEEEMIERLERMLKMNLDDRVAEILRYILQDEMRHHTALTRMANLLDREETSQDEYLSLALKYMFIQPP